MKFSEKLAARRLYNYAKRSDEGMGLAEYLASRFTRFDLDGWKKAIAEGRVSVNGKIFPAETRLHEHDCIAFYPGEQPEPEADLRFETVYEDDDILVLNKPGDLCVHPTGPFFRHTLWHLAGEKYGELRFVNRLDRETSGLVAAARNKRTAGAMTNGKCPMKKEYTALVSGHFQGAVHAKGVLVRDEKSVVAKKKRFVLFSDDPEAEQAETFLSEIRYENNMTLVRALPVTGRQHQIRATLFSLGFPLIGDKLYGSDERLFLKIRTQSFTGEDALLLRMKRQALHSGKLEFLHPFTGKTISCTAPLPEDFLLFPGSCFG